MNLNKLFNAKYLLQNMKKSKMTIALFFILVPVFTSLMMIAAENYTFEFGSLASINILGMYIIPLIFSISLFGYVFKKNSVDFIGSMPISRKCIFITNTIGGITLIVLMQIVTFVLTVLIGSLTKGIIFTSMAWDIFIYQTIAYLFVFTVANLAMSVSGNLVTQIAVTMLIVFVVPFSTWYVSLMSGNTDYKLMNHEIEIMEVNKNYNFTAPFLIANEGIYEYNAVSMGKMLLLSIVYFAIGYYAFHKKKMEVAGESFENKYVHYFVKGLTLLPFVAILKAISMNTSLTIFVIVIAIIFVYYIIFDLITSKKIKLWENIIAVTFSIATIYGVYSMAIGIDKNVDKKLNLDSIKEVTFNVNHCFNTNITDKSKISSSIITLSKAENNFSYYKDDRYDTEITLVRNDGTKFTRTVYLSGKTLREMFDESFKNDFIGNHAVISNTQVQLTKQENADILKYINESYQDMTLNDILNARSGGNYFNVILSEYKNHQLIQTYYPVTLNKDIQKLLISAYNRYAINFLKSGYRNPYYMIDSFDRFDEETREKVWFATERTSSSELTNFILKNEDNIPEDISNCIKMSTYQFEFFTDKIDEFLTIVNQICEENKEEYEAYQKGYEEDNPIEINESEENLQLEISGNTI